MRILRIYQRIPPKPGGMENHIKTLTEKQLEAGDKVEVFFVEGDKISSDDVRINALPYTKIKPQALSNLLFYFQLILFCILNKKKYDVIHIHGDFSSFIFAKVLKNITFAQVSIGSFHGKINRKKFKWVKFAFKQPDIIYTTGKSESLFLTSELNFKVHWIHSGVNQIYYKTDKEMKTIDVLTVANCFPIKNIQLLLEIAKSLPEISFVHIGGGDWLSFAVKAKQMGLTNIQFKGPQSQDETAFAMASAKIFLLTSLEEGTPTVILEALVSQCYVISTNSCDLTDIINHGDGCVGKTFNSDEYKQYIANYLDKEKDNLIDFKHTYSSFSWSEVQHKIGGLIKSYLLST